MATTREEFDGQLWLLHRMHKLNKSAYKVSLTGMCLGISLAAVQAMMISRVARLNLLLRLIASIPLEDFSDIPRLSNAVANYYSTGKGIGAESPFTVWDVLALFDSVVLSQHSKLYQHLFSSPVEEQDPVAALKLLEANVARVDRFSGVYSPYELKHYLDEFDEVLNGEPIFNTPVSFIISAERHAIMIGYDTAAKYWVFMNSNDEYAQAMRYTDTENLSRAIMAAFDPTLTSSHIVMRAEVCGLTTDSIALKAKLQAWKQQKNIIDMHVVTKEKAEYVNNKGMSWIHFAAWLGEEELVQALIGNKTNVNQITPGGTTPFSIALNKGHVKIVEALIKAGASMDLINNDLTALMIAARNGDADMVQLLLRHNASTNAVTNQGQTALMYAAAGGHTDICQILLNHGAEANTKDEKNTTALHLAVAKTDFPTVKLLLPKTNIDYKNLFSLTQTAEMFNLLDDAQRQRKAHNALSAPGFFSRLKGLWQAEEKKEADQGLSQTDEKKLHK